MSTIEPNSLTPDLDLEQIEDVVADLQQSPVERPAQQFVGFETMVPDTVAQFDAQSSQARLASPVPTPPPKRPKGRLLIGTFLMALLGFGAYFVWDGVFRFHAYGQVEANRVPVRALTSGIVQRIYVAEGDVVRAGDLLAIIHNVDLEHRLHRTRNDLRLAEAQLDALMTRLRRDSQEESAEYFELASKLRAQRSQLEALDRSLARMLKLKNEHIITDEEYDKVYYSQKGQGELVELLKKAVDKLQHRTDSDTGNLEIPVDILQPAIVRIENIKDELARLQESIKRVEVRAPATGVIVKRDFVTGNWVGAGQILIEVVEECSTEPVIYLPQKDTLGLEVGMKYHVFIEPNQRPIECEVKRIGDEFIHPPISIERFYDKHEPLLPVALEPIDNVLLKPGAMIKVPREIDRFNFDL